MLVYGTSMFVIDIPPPKSGISMSVYLSEDLLRRIEVIQKVTGYKKRSPVIELLLVQAVEQWERENPEAIAAHKPSE